MTSNRDREEERHRIWGLAFKDRGHMYSFGWEFGKYQCGVKACKSLCFFFFFILALYVFTVNENTVSVIQFL